MIFQLVDEGTLSLATTLDAFFPALPNAARMTIGMLLNHRSGLHNFTDDPDYPTWMTQPKTQGEMLAVLSRRVADFAPGERAAYSNSNYVLLGYVIESVTKRSYADNVRERISARIGLQHTYVGGTIDPGKNESRSFYHAGTWTALPETDMSIPGGAGAVVSTPTDLVKFIEALFLSKIVSRQSLERMRTITDGFGMGMLQMPFDTKKAFGHGGAIDGFGANVAYFPEDSIAVAYCSNGQVYPLNDILIGVLSIVFGRDYAIPTFETLSLQPEALDGYLGVYSSTQLPLKITITKDGKGLVAQATGQQSFPLEAVSKDTFTFDRAGVRMEFTPAKREMTLKQGGGVYLFSKGQ